MDLFLDSPVPDAQRRELLYKGHLFLYGVAPAATALCSFAREMLEEAFRPHDPRTAQHAMLVEDFAEILSAVKPAFINHPESKKLVADVLRERGCDLDRTYFDVPRLRSSTSDGYLTSGIAYAFHPHRDTWYSAPLCQLNWWMPVYPLPGESGMEVYPRYWSEAIANSSRNYNYARWVEESRFTASRHIAGDTREQPRAEQELDLDSRFIVNGPPGSLTVFSAAQLHGSARNLTGECRFSIDFRTVHIDDVSGGVGAPNIDSDCTGTTMGDYLKGSDLSLVPAELVDRYDRGA